MKSKSLYIIIVAVVIGVISCRAQNKLHGTYYSESGCQLKITKDSTLYLICPNYSQFIYTDTLAVARIKKVSNDLIELRSATDAINKVSLSMSSSANKDFTIRFDSIKVNFSFPNIKYEKLFIRLSTYTDRGTFRYYSFIYDDKNRSIKIPSEIKFFDIQVGSYASGNFDLNGLYHGIQYFMPDKIFDYDGENNNIEIIIPDINDAFFYRYYFFYDYARISDQSVTFKGITYRKKK